MAKFSVVRDIAFMNTINTILDPVSEFIQKERVITKEDAEKRVLKSLYEGIESHGVNLGRLSRDFSHFCLDCMIDSISIGLTPQQITDMRPIDIIAHTENGIKTIAVTEAEKLRDSVHRRRNLKVDQSQVKKSNKIIRITRSGIGELDARIVDGVIQFDLCDIRKLLSLPEDKTLLEDEKKRWINIFQLAAFLGVYENNVNAEVIRQWVIAEILPYAYSREIFKENFKREFEKGLDNVFSHLANSIFM